ncbi:MAG: hypothetical protein HW387_1362, partial [Parachlamydiales bacterium]|nr:hypothetical protein [Parachlamydiales bacterium]
QESHSTDGGQNWSTASNLSLEGQNARLPQVVMSSDGSKTITVWERSDGVNTIIQESHSTDSGQSWSAVVNLSLEGQSAELSQVAMSSSDGSQIVVVWQRSDGANTIIQESHSTDGGQNWSVAASLSLEGRSALDPQVAISSDGSKAVAVWQRSDGSNIIIQESHSTDGGQNWSAASNLSQGGRNAFDGQVAMNSDGSNIVAVWGRSDGVNYIVQESHSTDGGQNWSAGANLSLEGQDGGFPQVAMSSDGSKIVAVWARSEGASWIIQESHSTDGGQNWSAAANLSLSSAESTTSDIWGRSGRENWILQESHSTDGGQNWSAAAYVSLSSDGSNSVAVWRRFDGANWIIQESHSTDGGQNWSIASNLSLEGRNARLPQVVMSSDGSKTITVWERSDGANTIIQESHSTDGGQSWSAAVNLSLEGQSAELSQVAMSSNDGSQGSKRPVTASRHELRWIQSCSRLAAI